MRVVGGGMRSLPPDSETNWEKYSAWREDNNNEGLYIQSTLAYTCVDSTLEDQIPVKCTIDMWFVCIYTDIHVHVYTREINKAKYMDTFKAEQ